MKKDKRFEFKLTADMKRKLIRDSVLSGYLTPSAYLTKLIEMGPPVGDSFEVRLQLIEEKIDMLSKDNTYINNKILSIVQSIFKRNYIVYRIVSFLLARSFFSNPGRISEEDISSSDAFIRKELKQFEKKYEIQQ